jgi:hypothetical protein
MPGCRACAPATRQTTGCYDMQGLNRFSFGAMYEALLTAERGMVVRSVYTAGMDSSRL